MTSRIATGPAGRSFWTLAALLSIGHVGCVSRSDRDGWSMARLDGVRFESEDRKQSVVFRRR